MEKDHGSADPQGSVLRTKLADSDPLANVRNLGGCGSALLRTHLLFSMGCGPHALSGERLWSDVSVEGVRSIIDHP
jgi:hypothetical protein